jgi:very-short-patch-repair endonuclease
LIRTEFWPDAVAQAKVLANRRFSFDVYSPSQKIAVEVDGIYWHKRPEAVTRDLEKDRLAAEVGITIIRIPISRRRISSDPHKLELFKQEIRKYLTPNLR